MGAVLDSEFPYAGKQIACKTNLNHLYHIKSWSYLPSVNENTPPTVEAIKNAIFTYGPISAGIGANDALMSYSYGIFNACDGTAPNHAINLVGWDDDGQYFIMRNSWGDNFGIKGFAYIKYNCNSIGIAANYIVLDAVPNPNPNPNPTPNPSCTPMAVANIGNDISIKWGMSITIGTPPIAGTAYRWESSIKPNPLEKTSRIVIRPWNSRYYTLYAVTKCGTAKSTIMVYVKK